MLLEAGCDGAIELFGTYNGLSWVETADEVLVVDNTTGESVGRDWTSHPVAGGEGYVVIGVPDSEAHSIYTGVRPDSDLLSITGATAEQ